MPKMLSASEYERPGRTSTYPRKFRVEIEAEPHKHDVYSAVVYADSEAGSELICAGPLEPIERARASATEYRRKLGLLEAYRVDVAWLAKGEKLSIGSEMHSVFTECAGLDDCLFELVRQLEAKDKNVTEVHIYTPLAAWPQRGPALTKTGLPGGDVSLAEHLAGCIKSLVEKSFSWSATHKTDVTQLTIDDARRLEAVLTAALRYVTGAS